MTGDFDLTRVPIFHKLTKEESQYLQTHIEQLSVRQGETIFTQGDSADALYIVETGSVDIVIESPEGEVILATVSSGNFFGELGLFDGEPRTATARAAEDTNVLLLKRKIVVDFLRGNPSATLRILSVVIARLRHTDQMMRRLVTRNVNDVADAKSTLGQRVADRVANFGGSWRFIILFGCCLVLWMGLNVITFLIHPFDPYPFIFLNLVLSCLAAIQAPIIMMSQNRQSEKDRLRSELDFQVNLKAEIAIQHLHRKLDELKEYQLQELESYQQEQIRRLEELADLVRPSAR